MEPEKPISAGDLLVCNVNFNWSTEIPCRKGDILLVVRDVTVPGAALQRVEVIHEGRTVRMIVPTLPDGAISRIDPNEGMGS